MIELKQALVADHIEGLRRDGAALRAECLERAAHLTEPAHVEPVTLPVRLGRGPRVRIGRWLVAIGTAIGGTSERPSQALEDRSDAAPERLSRAA